MFRDAQPLLCRQRIRDVVIQTQIIDESSRRIEHWLYVDQYCIIVVKSQVYPSHYKHLKRGCWYCSWAGELHASLRNYDAFLAIVTWQWCTDDISVILLTRLNVLYLTGHCPYLCPNTGGICVEECSNDGDCADDLMCCSNGCGHTCQQPGIQNETHR